MASQKECILYADIKTKDKIGRTCQNCESKAEMSPNLKFLYIGVDNEETFYD